MSASRRIVIDYDSKFSPVNSKRTETLPDYVRRIRIEKRLSTVDVEKQSGNRISDSYVTRIENGYVKNVSPEKLQALAKGLGVTEDEIFAVVRGKSLDEVESIDAEMMMLASRVKRLTPQQRRDFRVAWQMANDLLDKLEHEKGGK